MIDDPEDDSELEDSIDYMEDVAQERDVINMVLHRKPLFSKAKTATELVDGLAWQAGLFQLGEKWIELTYEQAFAVLKRVYHKDLAYNTVIMHEERAEMLADRFLRFFKADRSRYFSNGTFYLEPTRVSDTVFQGPTWTPAKKATFDTGVIVFDDEKIGTIWVADED